MAETWPTALQQRLNTNGFGFKFGNTVARSDMDIGPAKYRQRFTRSVDTVTAQIFLPVDDWATFETFYKTTLAHGSKSFTYAHPLTGVDAEFRMKTEPSVRPLGGGAVFQIDMEWEILP